MIKNHLKPFFDKYTDFDNLSSRTISIITVIYLIILIACLVGLKIESNH